MIITRTPLRISFAGGGSDLPAFYSHDVGAVFSMTINLYMRIMLETRPPEFGVRLMYSQTENVSRACELRHEIARAALAWANVDTGIEIASMADVPAGSGLGSSGAYTVGLVAALASLRGRHGVLLVPGGASMHAARIEINDAGRAGGLQDHASAAYGGLRLYEFSAAIIARDSHDADTARELAARCLLFRVGATRNADTILARQAQIMKSHMMRNIAAKMADHARALDVATRNRDWREFGSIMADSWQIKRGMVSGITNDEVDNVVNTALDAGARAAKICGAGGGGYVLVLAEPDAHAGIRLALADYREQKFDYAPDGVQVVYRD